MLSIFNIKNRLSGISAESLNYLWIDISLSVRGDYMFMPPSTWIT